MIVNKTLVKKTCCKN